ncbi:MAG: hypothetical protein MJK10_05060 [Pseudomonadales bacterium]|nr:hypothetical protein [Pseudomonadales bacterium]NRA18432.1 hypothetical protein [Oceanospirillaceae bacterium]
MSAISKIGGLYYQNTDDLALYTEWFNRQQHAICRGVVLSRDDKIRRDLIKDLICHCYLDMDKFAAEQQLELTENNIQFTSTGRLLVRRFCRIFDRYLPVQQQQKFSRII